MVDARSTSRWLLIFGSISLGSSVLWCLLSRVSSKGAHGVRVHHNERQMPEEAASYHDPHPPR